MRLFSIAKISRYLLCSLLLTVFFLLSPLRSSAQEAMVITLRQERVGGNRDELSLAATPQKIGIARNSNSLLPVLSQTPVHGYFEFPELDAQKFYNTLALFKSKLDSRLALREEYKKQIFGKKTPPEKALSSHGIRYLINGQPYPYLNELDRQAIETLFVMVWENPSRVIKITNPQDGD